MINKVLQGIYDDLGIADTIGKHSSKKKKVRFERVKDIIPSAEDFNFQMDYLELPKTKLGYNRLLVMVDLATDEVDFEATKNKDSATTLKAMKAIFTRPYLNKPYATIRSDGGSEFKGVVKKYLYEQSILHTIALPGRHRQSANVESANRLISRALNGYMNNIEHKTGRVYNEWTTILDSLRKGLNKHRKKKITSDSIFESNNVEITDDEAKFKKGDMVYRQLDVPKDARGYDQLTQRFREGDITIDFIPRKIVRVLYYPRNIRYVLDGLLNVSYSEKELEEADEKEEVFEVKKIIGDKRTRGKKYYLVWFMGELKKDAIFIEKKQLIEDGLEDYIEFYENS